MSTCEALHRTVSIQAPQKLADVGNMFDIGGFSSHPTSSPRANSGHAGPLYPSKSPGTLPTTGPTGDTKSPETEKRKTIPNH